MDNIVSGKCMICGSDLVWHKDADNCFLTEGIGVEDGESGGFDVKEIQCKECGAFYRVWVSRDEVQKTIGYIGNQGFGNCVECGGTLAWSGDFMRSEIEGEEYSDDDDSVVHECNCSGCGNAVTIIEPSENEIKSGKFPYWNKRNENI